MNSFQGLWFGTESEMLEHLPHVYSKLSDVDRSALVDAILRGPPEGEEGEASPVAMSESSVFARLAALGQEVLEEHRGALRRYRSLLAQHPEWEELLSDRTQPRFQAHSKSTVLDVSECGSDQDLVDSIISDRLRTPDYLRSLSGLSVVRRCSAIRHANLVAAEPRAIRLLLRMDQEDLKRREDRDQVRGELAHLPEAFFREASPEVASLLITLAEESESDEGEPNLLVWDRVIPHCLEGDGEPEYSDWLTAAINSPIGHATQAILRILADRNLQRDSGLPSEFSSRLEAVVRSSGASAVHGRTLIASNLYLLSWIDFEWTTSVVVPLFSWAEAACPAGAWQGFLSNPRIDDRLFGALRDPLVEAFRHWSQLSGMGDNLCGLLVSLALDAPGLMDPEEVIRCLRDMGSDGLARVAWLLAKRLQATEAGKRSVLWTERISGWLSDHWPPESEFLNERASNDLSWACTLTESAFPEAVQVVGPLIGKARRPSLALTSIEEQQLGTSYPQPTLDLLARLLGPTNLGHFAGRVRKILESCVVANQDLAGDEKLVRLRDLVEK